MLWLSWLGCSSEPRCDSTDQVLAEGLTCEDARHVEGWIELLAGRALQHGGTRRLPAALLELHQKDPSALRKLLDEIDAAGAKLELVPGPKGAEARSLAVWEAHREKGPIRPDDGSLWNIQRDALSVWAWNDDDKLALTEADIEGWLTYASLCREVQNGGVLRISVADRVTAYRVLVDRFEGGSREERLSLASVGPFWEQIRDRWQAVPYERQQAWIGAAPLPPPMTATSLGYLQAIAEGPIVQHAGTLHEVLGPFSLNRGPRVFDE